MEIDPRRLARGEAAEPLDDRRGELGARHVAGHPAFALCRGRPRLFRPVHAGRAALAAGLYLVRFEARGFHPRRIAPRIRALHAGGRRLDARTSGGASRDRYGGYLAARHVRRGEQRRGARLFARPGDSRPLLLLVDSWSQAVPAGANFAEAGFANFRRIGPRRQPPGGDLGSTASASPMSRSVHAMRQGTHSCTCRATADSASPKSPITTPRSASCGWSAAASAWWPIFAAAANSAHALARRGPARKEAAHSRRFRRGRGRSRRARGRRAEAYRRRGRLERRHPDLQHADALSRTLRRAVLHHPVDRHAPLYEAARGRELDR